MWIRESFRSLKYLDSRLRFPETSFHRIHFLYAAEYADSSVELGARTPFREECLGNWLNRRIIRKVVTAKASDEMIKTFSLFRIALIDIPFFIGAKICKNTLKNKAFLYSTVRMCKVFLQSMTGTCPNRREQEATSVG